MMIDAATTRFEVALDRARPAVCPPDMTDARPRVVELWDRYGQLGIDDVPIASRTCPVLRASSVLEHGTDAGVGALEDMHRASRSTGPEPPTGRGGDVALWPEGGNEDLGQERQVALLGPPRDLGDAGGVGAHDGEAELAGRSPDGSGDPGGPVAPGARVGTGRGGGCGRARGRHRVRGRRPRV